MKRKSASCPQCGQPALLDKTLNPWRPFCSKRCRLIDLGGWLDESHRIPDESSIADMDETGPHGDTDPATWH